MALAEAATWPGTETRRNPYSSQWRAQRHEEKAARLIMELERQDNEIFEREIAYSMPQSFAPYPFYDANWMMDHDFSFL